MFFSGSGFFERLQGDENDAAQSDELPEKYLDVVQTLQHRRADLWPPGQDHQHHTGQVWALAQLSFVYFL